MSAPGFQAPPKRWDSPYTCDEFVPQHDSVLTTIANQFDGCHGKAADAVRLLGRCTPDKWEGSAADVFSDYLLSLATYFSTVRDTADEACTKVRRCARRIAQAHGEVQAWVTRLNDIQQNHNDYQEKHKDDDGLLDQLGNLVHDAEYSSELDGAYTKAAGYTEDALTALADLATDLDHADATLSALDAPAPPSITWDALTGKIPWSDVALLQSLFGPVSDNLQNMGDTDAANDAISRGQDAANGSDDDRRAFLDSLAGLTPEELRYVMDHLDENDISTLLGSLSPDDDRDTYNQLATNLPLDLLRRLGDTDPNHYWHPYPGDGQPYEWNVPDGTATSGNPDDLHQGGLGDCHLLSSLAAMETAHPGWLEDHCRRNPNGTYTVTLYKDGKPVDVVVTPELPYNQDPYTGDPSGPAFTQNANDGDPSLYAIYEKAFGQTWSELDPQGNDRTGYEGENGGDPTKDLSSVGPDDADYTPSGDASADDLRQAIAEHRPVVMSTTGDDQGGDIYDDEKSPNRYLIHGHAYYVTGVDSHGNVTVKNPWGNQNAGNGTVVLSWSEFQKYTQGVSVGK